jgi:hypothetical protein
MVPGAERLSPRTATPSRAGSGEMHGARSDHSGVGGIESEPPTCSEREDTGNAPAKRLGVQRETFE